VEVRSDRRWRFDVAPDVLWAALADVDAYRAWWPWLRSLEGAAFAPGAEWRCVVQPPLPYRLTFALTLEEVEPHRFVTAEVAGDIVGHAAIDLVAVDGGTDLRLVSTLAPRHPALRTVAGFAPAVARFGHDWVLDRGLAQFRRRALG
jgi:uncharacterized protein YndB with AHSA1/START domain